MGCRPVLRDPPRSVCSSIATVQPGDSACRRASVHSCCGCGALLLQRLQAAECCRLPPRAAVAGGLIAARVLPASPRVPRPCHHG